MHVHGLGNAQLVRVGLRHGRGRTHWERFPGYAERYYSSRVAQVFSRANDRVNLALPVVARFCQVCVMKRRFVHLPAAPR